MATTIETPRRRRRWFAISLRCSMLLVLAAGGPLGWWINRVRVQSRAVATIKDHRGIVVYDLENYRNRGLTDDEPQGPAWLRKLVGGEPFRRVESVDLHEEAITEEVLAAVGRLDRLESLRAWAWGKPGFGDGLIHLRGLGRLKDLNLLGAGLTDAKLAQFGDLPALETVRIERSDPIGDAGLASLARLPALRRIKLDPASRITDAGVEPLVRAHPDLEELDIGGSGLTDPRLPSLLRMKRLKSLNLNGARLSAEGLARLSALKELETLELGGTAVDDRTMMAFGSLKNLLKLNLSGTRITGAGMAQLAGLTKLEKLDLSSIRASDAGMAHLADLKGLEVLLLNNTPITDAGVAQIAGLPRLDTLLIEETRITDAGLAMLQKLPRLRCLMPWHSNQTLAGIAAFRKAKPYVDFTGEFVPW